MRRQIQIGLVKGSKKQDSTQEDQPTFNREEVMDTASVIMAGTGRLVVQVMVSYMALDTIRKIAISRLSK